MFARLSKPDTLRVQCLACGRVEEPASDFYRCPRCGGFDVHVYSVR